MEIFIELMKSLCKKYGRGIVAWLLIIGAYGLLFALGITCPIRYLLGISCPGCGMTRACVSALQLDFSAAFAYHPLWILLPFAVVFMVLCRWRRWRRALRICVATAVIALCTVYVLRMVHATSNVVVFEPQNGLIGRGIRAIFGESSA